MKEIAWDRTPWGFYKNIEDDSKNRLKGALINCECCWLESDNLDIHLTLNQI